jgi:hypothetical protein
MNFSAGSGGLMLVALAAVWFIVFMPTVGKRNSGKNDAARNRRQSREKVAIGSSPELAKRASRAKVAQFGLAAMAAGSATVAIVSVFQGQSIWASAAVVFAGVFVVLTRLVSTQASRAVLRDSNRRTKIGNGLSNEISEKAEEFEVSEDKTWSPNQLPAQAYRSQVGTLENPTLADVVNIEFPGELATETLDEILRRRRAN